MTYSQDTGNQIYQNRHISTQTFPTTDTLEPPHPQLFLANRRYRHGPTAIRLTSSPMLCLQPRRPTCNERLPLQLQQQLHPPFRADRYLRTLLAPPRQHPT